MKTASADQLFTPIQVGPMELKHRVVMAPLTRSRSVQPGSIPGDLTLRFRLRAADGSEPPACIRMRTLQGGRESRTPFMGNVDTCSPNSGIRGVLRTWNRRTA